VVVEKKQTVSDLDRPWSEPRDGAHSEAGLETEILVQYSFWSDEELYSTRAKDPRRKICET